MSVLKVSPHGSFKVTQLCESVVICEAQKGDPLGWGNGDEQGAFIVYVGCTKEEKSQYIERLFSIYQCQSCEPRKPKYLKDFEVEIKIKGMRRTSSHEGLGLDHLLESEEEKLLGISYDEYNYYCSGYLPRW